MLCFTDGPFVYMKDQTREQTKYIYRKVETGEIINTDTIEQEIEQEEQLSKIDDSN